MKDASETLWCYTAVKLCEIEIFGDQNLILKNGCRNLHFFMQQS